MIPATYDHWRHCIEVDCGIALEPGYIQARIAALGQPGQEPSRFAKLYGDAHLQRVLGWFRRVAGEIPST